MKLPKHLDNAANRYIESRILPAKKWNEENPNNKVPFKYGYVMPIYHGYQWKKTKTELINMFCY